MLLYRSSAEHLQMKYLKYWIELKPDISELLLNTVTNSPCKWSALRQHSETINISMFSHTRFCSILLERLKEIIKKVLFWEPKHGKRNRGRPCTVYIDTLKKNTFQMFFFSIIMIVTRYKTIKKNTCNSAPTTIYYAVGGKSKSKILSSNNSWHGKL